MKNVLILIVLMLFAVPLFAETFIWEDAQGTVNYADDLGKVPKQYRKKVKVFGEEEPPPQDSSEKKEPASDQGEHQKGAGEGASVPKARDEMEKPSPQTQTGAEKDGATQERMDSVPAPQ